MRTFAVMLIAAVAALSLDASGAQEGGPTRIEMVPPSDTPGASVPLRDFLMAEIEALDRRLTELLDKESRFVTQRFDLTDINVGLAFTAAQKAADKAEEAQALRNIVSNEFRGSLSDLGNTMARRDWAESQFQNVTDRLDRLTEQISALDVRVVEITSIDSGKQESQTLVFAAVAAGGVVAGIVVALVGLKGRATQA